MYIFASPSDAANPHNYDIPVLHDLGKNTSH